MIVKGHSYFPESGKGLETTMLKHWPRDRLLGSFFSLMPQTREEEKWMMWTCKWWDLYCSFSGKAKTDLLVDPAQFLDINRGALGRGPLFSKSLPPSGLTPITSNNRSKQRTSRSWHFIQHKSFAQKKPGKLTNQLPSALLTHSLHTHTDYPLMLCASQSI